MSTPRCSTVWTGLHLPRLTAVNLEAPMAQVVSLKMFSEPPSLGEGLGMSLIVVAAGVLVWTARGSNWPWARCVRFCPRASLFKGLSSFFCNANNADSAIFKQLRRGIN